MGLRRRSTSCRSAGRRGRRPRPARSSFSSCSGCRTPADASTIYFIGVATFLACRRRFCVSAAASSARSSCSTGSSCDDHWRLPDPGADVRAVAGVAGGAARLRRLRSRAAALRLLSGRRGPRSCSARWSRTPDAGGVTNLVLANWARDRGYGMGERAGYIPAAVGGQKVHLAHTGFMFAPSAESMRPLARLVAHRPRRSVGRVLRRRDPRHGAAGAALCDVPAARAPTFRDSASARRSRRAVGAQAGRRWSAALIAFLGAWILFKTQLDNLEGMVRAITDILWTGSSRVRAWRGGDVRAVYYTRARRPRGLGHHRAAARAADRAAEDRRQRRRRRLRHRRRCTCSTSTPASCRQHVRPPMWRRVALVAMAVFYAFFVALSIAAGEATS